MNRRIGRLGWKGLSIALAVVALLVVGGSYAASAGFFPTAPQAPPVAAKSSESTPLELEGMPADTDGWPPSGISFLWGEAMVLSGSSLYQAVASIEVETSSAGYVIVHASGTIMANSSGTYVDVGLSTDSNSVAWAHRAGMPEADIDGLLSWPFDIAHVFEPGSAGEHTFYLNGRQLGSDGPVMVELGSMYALSVPPPPELISNSLHLASLNTAYNPGDARSPAGVFTITATFTNTSPDSFSDVFFEVKILTGDNQVLNCSGGPGGVGCMVPVPPEALGEDGVLSPGESFTQVFEIGLAVRQPFDFFVDAFGLPGGP